MNSRSSSCIYLKDRPPSNRGEHRVEYQCVPFFLLLFLCARASGATSLLTVRRHGASVRVVLATAATAATAVALFLFILS